MPAVEQCPHRENVQFEGREETARCGLLGRIADCGRELSSFRVPRGACEACVEGVPPAVDRLNSVLASFLYSASAEIIALGGTPACDVTRAAELQEWAKSAVEVDVTGRHPTPTGPRSYRDCDRLGPVIGYRQEPSLLGLLRTAVHDCHHPDHDITTQAACNRCLDWSRSTSSQTLALSDLLPRPVSWTNAKPIQWAVGITTAPRRNPTLETCLDYLGRAGWDNIRLAVDGTASLPPTMSVEQISLRTPAVGAWPNYYLTLLELVLSEPAADAFMVVQDDAQFYDRENVRQYLESILWPSDPPGIVSLYCSAAYTRQAAGWAMAEERWEWGALAFVFPAELARRFVSDPEVVEHRGTDRGLRYIDDVIGEWAQRNAVPIWFPTPSLIQHIGETSTVWPGVPAAGYRRADSFAGDL